MTLGEAREAAKKALAEADRGIDPADHALVHGAQVHADTVGSVVDAYLERRVKKAAFMRPVFTRV